MNTPPKALSLAYAASLVLIVMIALIVGAASGRIGTPTTSPAHTVTVTVTSTPAKK